MLIPFKYLSTNYLAAFCNYFNQFAQLTETNKAGFKKVN